MLHWRYATNSWFYKRPGITCGPTEPKDSTSEPRGMEFPTTNAEGTVQAGYLYKIG